MHKQVKYETNHSRHGWLGIEVRKIRHKIGVFVLNAIYRLELWAIKHLTNKSDVFRYVAISHARIIASQLFDSNTVSENINLAIAAIYKLSNVEASGIDDKTDFEQVQELTHTLETNKNVQNLLAEYHLAISYAFSKASLTDTTQISDEHTAKAKLFNADIEPFETKSFDKRLNEVKTERKVLQKKLNQILKNKIAKVKEEQIGKISLTPSDVTILLSMFSTLFLISGYYYNHSLLSELNVNSDHFYLLSDYISTSVSLIVTPFIWTAIFVVFFLLGASNQLDNRIKENQLKLQINDKPPVSFPLLIILINIMELISLFQDHSGRNYTVLAMNGLIVSLYFIEKIPFHYFKHPIKIFSCVFVCIGFFWNLNTKVDSEIQKIKSDDYQPMYLVEFDEKMVLGESMEFIALNSNYIIMRGTDSKRIEIYPKSHINKLMPNPVQGYELNFFEWMFKFIELNQELYEVIANGHKEKN
ncbi:hypothetical protein ACMZOO_16460 [Catenovulum sp. SX2]|uniref:hypothetical protein n=1 Tax=Catenovulum sp. SX2 TaxID=3398614 RepID=UPI003F849D5E